VISADCWLIAHSDAFALSKANRLPISQVLDLLQAFSKEDDYTVGAPRSSSADGLRSLTVSHNAQRM